MKSKHICRLLIPMLAVCLLVLEIAAAAPVVPKSPTVVRPADPKFIAAMLIVTAPTSGATWYTGSTQTVTWNGIGPRATTLGPVDVTLWRSGQLAVTIAAATASESVTYTVPYTLAAGAYELRVTSKNHANLEARQPLTVAATTVTLGPTPTTLVAGTSHTITWTQTGNPGPLDLALMYTKGGATARWYFIARNLTGNSYSWSLSPTFANEEYKLQFQLTSAATGMIYSTSTLFTVSGITFTTPQANEQILAGSPYFITWNYAADPEAPFSLALVGQGQETTILSNLHPADRSAKWPAPQPAYGTSFQLVAYAAGTKIAIGRSPSFTFKTPVFTVGKPFTNTITSDGIVANHPYCIPYNSELPPASYKIEIIKATDGQVVETVIANTTISKTATGLYCYWTPSATHPAAFYGQNYKVRMTGLAAGGPVVESPPFPIYQNTSSGSQSGNPGTGSTGTTGTGTTGTVTVTPPASGGPSTVQLSKDTYYHYNAQDSACFAKGSIVTLDGSGYATLGQLAGDQYLKYRSGKTVNMNSYSVATFSGGYLVKGQLASDQGLEYASGKTVYLYGLSPVTFSGGYVTQGQLSSDQGLEYGSGKKVYLRGFSVVSFTGGYVSQGQLDGSQSLEYGSYKKTTFIASSGITFSGGYVSKGQLAYDTALEYAVGKKATFYTVGMTVFRSGGFVKSGVLAYETYLTDTTGKSQKVPALSVVNFDDSGRLVSFTTSNFNLNP